MRLIDADALKPHLQFSDDGELCWEIVYASEIKNAPTIEARPEWISVYDQMPEQRGMPCLVVAENRYGQRNIVKAFTNYEHPIDFMTNEKQFDNCWHMWKVTHWMPMPEPPNCGADMRGTEDDARSESR